MQYSQYQHCVTNNGKCKVTSVNTYVQVEEGFQQFLTSALEGRKLSVSRLGCFIGLARAAVSSGQVWIPKPVWALWTIGLMSMPEMKHRFLGRPACNVTVSSLE
jgi:hypothetical protein